MINLAMLALELAERTLRSAITGREYTLAEHAVILSTYVDTEHAVAALLFDAYKLNLIAGPSTLVEPGLLACNVAELRLATDESGIAFMPPHHAAHVYMTRVLEFAVFDAKSSDAA